MAGIDKVKAEIGLARSVNIPSEEQERGEQERGEQDKKAKESGKAEVDQ
jgi:hypothetical protein